MRLFKKLKHDTEPDVSHNNINIPEQLQPKVLLNINGKNNTITIKAGFLSAKSRISISIFGDNNVVTIDEDISLSGHLNILIGQDHKNFAPVKNCEFSIGARTSIETMSYSTFNSGSKCHIGSDCMIAFDVTILGTDAHPIFDLNSRKIINFVKEINIGNHVWIGTRAAILKNTIIADDCVVGYGAIVSGRFEKPHCAIAGNPAKIIKENITWDSYGYEYCCNDGAGGVTVATPDETVDKIIRDRCSLCRFGDGEFRLMQEAGDLDFQKMEPVLLQRLKEVWDSDDENIMIATNWHFFNSLIDVKNSQWVKNYLPSNRQYLDSITKPGKQYYATEISCMYMVYKNMDYDAHYAKLRKIWDNRDVVLVQGQGIRDKHVYNIFDNVKSLEYVFAPSKDAFSEYNDILKQVKQHDKDKLILIILGPTATVLAYDLAKCGYQALDIGHVSKDYDYYMQKKGNSIDFFLPD